MNEKVLLYRKRKILSLIGIQICMIFIFLLCQNNIDDTNKVESLISKVDIKNENTYLSESTYDPNAYIYLSDIPYVKNESRPGWGSIHINETDNGSNFSIKIEGAFYNFEKGIWAHASSTMVYDLTNYQDYDYFTTYTAVNSSSGNKGNGVKFYIYTSKDGKTWDLKTDPNPSAVKSSDDANFVKIDIKGVKFLKLVANDNGANGNDHSVYVDSKLIKENYKEEADVLVIDTKQLDEKIKKEYSNASLDNKDYELLILQRKFISNVGNYALKKFLNESELNKQTYTWLTSDVENLRLYMLGGQPDGGNYYNSLTELSRLYNEYSDDFTNKELLNNKWYPQMTYGDLYKKMAITLSLTHSQKVNLWMQGNTKENISDSLRRYAIFKYLHKNGKFKVTDSIDITPWFETLQVEEMRFVMNNAIDDEEILWLNDYVQSNINKYPNQAWKYLTPHPYMAYVWPNYSNPVYYDEANKDYFNELFAVNGTGLFDLSYTIPGGKNTKSYTLSVTRGTSEYKLYKVWMNMRNKFGTGAVCGGISKTGSNIRTTHGIPATVIGQPGHAALLYYSKDANGKGYWNIDNDVSGWTLSEKGERLLLGWGNANTNYAKGSYQVVYMALSQEAINDYENLVKAEEEVMLAEVYKEDLKKQEEIYRKALKVQPINVDAWLGLINVYLSSNDKTEDDYYNLSLELAESLKYYPLPMYQLTNLIKPKLTSVENSYRFTLLQTRILTEASKTPNNTAENYYVYQPSLTRTEANFLLGKIDKTIATFSFDGDDAGKIVLSSRFDKNGVRMDYSIDGKNTWNEVSFTAEEEHKIKLTDKQIGSITSENDIYIHIVGTSYDEDNLYKIDITEQTLPESLYANDLENRVIGTTNLMEWRYNEKDKWTSYEKESPNLIGNKSVQIRIKANGTKLTSDYKTYNFTEDNDSETRKYIGVSRLSIDSVSSEATGGGQYGNAIYSIDGNYNTRWHSAWNGSDNQKYIVIKLDKKVSLSAMDYVPAGGGNGKILEGQILGSIDGEKYTEIGHVTWANNEQIKTIDFTDKPKVQYIKIVGLKTSTAGGGSFMAARMFNFYEDLTKNVPPTANIKYSTTDKTSGHVVATLINPSTEIKITNNNGSDSYVFKENGEFTFEFEDKDGIKGEAKAKVDWIIKESEDNKPGETEKPGEDNKPGGTEKPGEDNKPGETEKPGENNKPGETEKPGEDNKPGETEKPGEDNKPGGTEKPGEDNKPGETEKPTENNKPENKNPSTNNNVNISTSTSNINSNKVNTSNGYTNNNQTNTDNSNSNDDVKDNEDNIESKEDKNSNKNENKYDVTIEKEKFNIKAFLAIISIIMVIMFVVIKIRKRK